MMFKKKCVSVVIAAVMTLTISTGAAFAAESDQDRATMQTGSAAEFAEKIAKVKAEDPDYWPNVAARNADRLFGNQEMLRIYGSNRYDTALVAAGNLKKSLDYDKFHSIIVASGENYPDALTASYVSFAMDAPVLLVNGETAVQKKVLSYIENNLEEEIGLVYILGGEGAVSKSFERKIKSVADTKRLGGADRYETNLAIIKEIPLPGIPVLVCSGKGFADSLSASGIGFPILLVGDQLTASQKQYLSDMKVPYCYILGGTGAVSSKVESQLRANLDECTRIAGNTRYETSAEFADFFYADEDDPANSQGYAVNNVVLAYAQNFPDGLSSGPIASQTSSPLILVDNHSYQAAAEFAAKVGIQRAAVSGGPSLISDRVAGAMIHK